MFGGKIGPMELLVILAIALLIFGPSKLADLDEGPAEWLRNRQRLHARKPDGAQRRLGKRWFSGLACAAARTTSPAYRRHHRVKRAGARLQQDAVAGSPDRAAWRDRMVQEPRPAG